MKRKIFAVLGVMPETGGYAAAKFSRTPTYKSFKDWVLELTEEGSEKFYNAFYFQYGHASIADLAHLMVVFENISMPARHLLLDDQLIDVQSRSTRYVDYSKAVFITPPEIKKDPEILSLFRKTIKESTHLYFKVLKEVADLYEKKYAQKKPAGITDEEYRRTLKARAMDVARYLLPSAAPKSMGVIGSGRTWERIITKFLSSPLQECQEIGIQLKKAICQKRAFNVALIKIDRIPWLSAKEKAEIKKAIAGKNIALPTLVKYAEKKDYPSNVYQKVEKLSRQLVIKEKPDDKRGVEMFEGLDAKTDFVTSLFYKVTPYSYGQILKAVRKKGNRFLDKVVDIAYSFCGPHDYPLKEAEGRPFVFDICMDIGGFRDLHRHRNCTHILKKITPEYGFDMPREIAEVGLGEEYKKMMGKIEAVYEKIEKRYKNVGEYILPQGTRRRFLMKVSAWELQYIVELRTKPQGHFSYREIAYNMYRLFARKYPAWGKHIRVTDPEKIDFFKR